MEWLPHAWSQVLGTLTSFGFVLACVGLCAAWVLLASDNRRRLRWPFALLVSHLLCSVAHTTLHEVAVQDSFFAPLSSLLLLLCLGQTSILLFVDGVLVRRLHYRPPKIFRDIIAGLVYMAVALLSLRAAGVDTGSLLTTSALLTAIIGLSLQDTLGNLFAGLSLQGEQPFNVGDWIQFGEESKLVGRVTEINWRATKIVTLSQVELTIPNGQLARAAIMNYSTPNRTMRRSIHVVVAHGVPPRHAKQVIVRALHGMEGVLKRPAPAVLSDGFEERGVRYWVLFFMDDYARIEWVESEAYDRVWYALQREGLSPAVPAHRVLVQQVDELSRWNAPHLDLDQRIEALRQVDFLADVSEVDLQRLADRAQSVTYVAGESIVRQGDPGASLFVCIHGQVQVVLEVPYGPERELAQLGPGGLFGEFSAMTGAPRSATVRAVEDTELLRLDKAAFHAILADHPPLAEEISERLSERKAQLESLSPVGRKEPAGEDAIGNSQRDALVARIRGFFGI